MKLNNKYDQVQIDYPGPFSIGPEKIINCLCPDNTLRTAYCSPCGPDSFFSIPSKVYAKGKTVAGYITRDTYTENDLDIPVWKFIPYKYRNNWQVVS